MSGRILIVDDEPSMCQMIEADLRLREFHPSWVTSADAALESLHCDEYDVILTDLKMPGLSGIDLCERVVANRPDLPVVVMTAFGSMETAIAAIRAGAYDFVTKPIEMDMLALTLERALKHRQLQEQLRVLSETLDLSKGFAEILGSSPEMLKVFDQLTQIADTETSVLISGETGTGKEIAARSIHSHSRRRDKPFVVVNCAALPEALVESELFGHAKGAFTDARSERKGLFLQAEGGTLFLDEIGEMPLSMQPKLLRALEEGRIRPVGGDQEIPFDARLVSATNRDLETAVQEQRFREDLYYRINVIQIELPPLRARGTDTLVLAQHFLAFFAARSAKQIVGLSEPIAEKLLAYDWPGNVRELRNVMALARHDKLVVDDLPERIRDYRRSQVYIGGTDPTELVPMEEIERRYILHALQSLDGNKTLAARTLGLDRKTLYRKLQQYGAVADEQG